jgi:hypothetical protein
MRAFISFAGSNWQAANGRQGLQAGLAGIAAWFS